MHTPHILPALLCCSPPLLTQRHHQHHHGSSMSGSSEPPVWLLPAVASAAAATSLYHSLLWPPLVLLALALVAASSLASVVLGRDQHSTSSSAAKPEQVLALIKQRRSVFPKDFSGDNSGITQDVLEQMLEAARWAPTHKLTEPWHFVVLGGASKAAFEELTIQLCGQLLPPDKAAAMVDRLRGKQQTAWHKVHSYIALCMLRHEAVPEWEEMCAVACAVQNLVLQATALGVAGYWSSWQPVARDAPAMHQFLGIDGTEGDRCLGVFVVGRADAARVEGYRPRRRPLADKVVWKLQ